MPHGGEEYHALGMIALCLLDYAPDFIRASISYVTLRYVTLLTVLAVWLQRRQLAQGCARGAGKPGGSQPQPAACHCHRHVLHLHPLAGGHAHFSLLLLHTCSQPLNDTAVVVRDAMHGFVDTLVENYARNVAPQIQSTIARSTGARDILTGPVESEQSTFS